MMNFLILAFVLGCLAHHGHATFCLSDLQPIVGFSDACTSAYETPITKCDSKSLALSSSNPSCSQSCYNQLAGVTAAIQSSCRGSGANPDTIVGHAFVGNLPDFLCGKGNFVAGPVPAISSGSATNAISSTSSTAAAAASTSTSQTSESSAATTTASSAASSSAASSTSSQSSSSEVSSTTLITSTTARSSSTSTAELPRSTSSSNSISDSTPFDQTASAVSAASVLRPPHTIGECILHPTLAIFATLAFLAF